MVFFKYPNYEFHYRRKITLHAAEGVLSDFSHCEVKDILQSRSPE